jgi:hypothetical protein
MAVLDRQIDSIERNDRLIEMTKDQQAMLAQYDKFGEVGNLGQLESKLAELRTVQEAQLEALSRAGVPNDYEQRAKAAMADEQWADEDPLGLSAPGISGSQAGPPSPAAANPPVSTTGLSRRGI